MYNVICKWYYDLNLAELQCHLTTTYTFFIVVEVEVLEACCSDEELSTEFTFTILL